MIVGMDGGLSKTMPMLKAISAVRIAVKDCLPLAQALLPYLIYAEVALGRVDASRSEIHAALESKDQSVLQAVFAL